MSWLQIPFKSLQLFDDPVENYSGGGSDVGEVGVKEDLSLIGKSIGRQSRGVAAFMAPAPNAPSHKTPASPASDDTTIAAAEDESKVNLSSQQALSGIRSDLAELCGSLKSSLSFFSSNSAVTGISKLASTLLQLNEEETGELDYDDHVIAISDEVVQFVREISARPECWTDFPLWLRDDFDISGAQADHALTIEQLVPGFSRMREMLTSNMSESKFWMIYFILLHPRLNESDGELLSTPQIVEARNSLLMLLKNKRSEVPNSYEDQVNFRHVIADEKEKDVNSCAARIVSPPKTSMEIYTRKRENAQNSGVEKAVEDDISFSDLEDDDTDLPPNRRRFKEMSSASSTDGSNDWVQLKENADSSRNSRACHVNMSGKSDSDGEDSSGWLTIGESDPDN